MTDRADAEAITVYADYCCPFCYLGREALDRYRARRDEPLAIDWRPFDLRYDRRGADGSLEAADDETNGAYFERATDNVRRLRERFDVDMNRELATDVDSRPAQLVSVAVGERAPERWEPFDAAVYGALWRDDRDIASPTVLADLAGEAGLAEPESLVRTALADEELSSRLDERFLAARRAGVTGVPTFVVDDRAARGAVPPDHIERLVEGPR